MNSLPSYSKQLSSRYTTSTSLPLSSSSQEPKALSKQQIQLQQSVNNIALLNRKEHDWDVCACEECIYSRQLNRKRTIGLQLSKNSIYRQYFGEKSKQSGIITKGEQVNYQKMDRNRGKSLHLDLSSMYNNEFPKGRPMEAVNRRKPQDQLKFVGPIKGLSSNQQQYFAFKGNNSPYIKPLPVRIDNSNIKFDDKTTYHSNYTGTAVKPTQTGKNPDNLKSGPWLANQSTYKQIYQAPAQPQTYSRYDLSRQRRSESPSYGHQYQTTYRNEFAIEKKEKCSRKSRLESTGSRLLQQLTMTFSTIQQ